MPRINFDKINDIDMYAPLPEGEYLCILDKVEEKTSQNGNEMWGLEWVVFHGDYDGRRIFDNLVFTDKAMKRIKLFCEQVGIETKGERDLSPQDIRGKNCYVTVMHEQYQDEQGNSKPRNKVPFSGYRKYEDKRPPVSEKLPF